MLHVSTTLRDEHKPVDTETLNALKKLMALLEKGENVPFILSTDMPTKDKDTSHTLVICSGSVGHLITLYLRLVVQFGDLLGTTLFPKVKG